jgi:hypothetical protein
VRVVTALLHRDEPRKLLAVLTAPEHPLAQHPDSAAALQELGLLFDYLEVRVQLVSQPIPSVSQTVGCSGRQVVCRVGRSVTQSVSQ